MYRLFAFLPESQIKIKSQFEEMYQEYNNNTPYSQLILTGMLHKLFLQYIRNICL